METQTLSFLKFNKKIKFLLKRFVRKGENMAGKN